MDKRLKLVFLLCVAAVLGTDAAGIVIYTRRAMVRLHNPVNEVAYPRSFIAAGDAWSKGGYRPVSVEAAHPESGTVLDFAAKRDAIKYRGKAVADLPMYSVRLELPMDGEWEIRAKMPGAPSTEPSGLASETRKIIVRDGASERLFAAFGPEHLAALGVLAALCLAVVLRYRKPRGKKEIFAVSLVIALALLLNETALHIVLIATDAWTVYNNLMIHMCGISVLVVPFIFFMEDGKRKQLLFEVAWFWGLGGAFQACLAPDIFVHSFPDPRYFFYFIAHELLVVGPLFLAMAYGLRLTLRSYLRGMGISLGATALAWCLDQITRFVPPYSPSNYFIMGYPTPTGSIVDVFADIFGPSPAYGIGLGIMGVALFGILYLPFPVLRVIRERRQRNSEPREDEVEA